MLNAADDDEARRYYDRHANSVIVKPLELDRFVGLVREIDRFWLNTVELPGTDYGVESITELTSGKIEAGGVTVNN
jgi:hypothetical protein